ncbi:MAG: DUF6056 family protein [Bacteroidota bacterium]
MAKKKLKSELIQESDLTENLKLKKATHISSTNAFSINNFSLQAVIIAVLGLIFYFNTFSHEYAHDDGIVIVKNEYVYSGFEGIPKILSKDAYDSYYTRLNAQNQLSGGRYRPLSIVTFAIEQQLFGSNKIDINNIAATYGVIGPEDANIVHVMHIRHVVNVLLYMLSVVVLLYFLRTIVFPDAPIIAFLAALLFTIHPLHTEVVANAKSRDEIMSLLFICLTFIYAYRYKTDNKILTLLISLLCFFLALLSKEYAVTVLVLLPLMLYLFKGYSIPKSLQAVLPFLLVFIGYMMIRMSIVSMNGEGDDNEILNNPYAFVTTGSQKIATEIATMLNYIKLLIFPHPLSADYSYNQIPYKDFTNPIVWLSILMHLGLIVWGIILFKKRHVLCFAVAFYLLHLALVCNLIFNIGATMGERLIYHSSVGFTIIVAYLLYKGYEKIKPASVATGSLAVFVSIIVVLSGFKTITRNADWKNDHTLFLKDVQTAPNSVLTNADAGACYIGMSDLPENKNKRTDLLNKAIVHLDKAIALHPKFTTGYLNRGVAYYGLGDIDKAKNDWQLLKQYFPSYPTLPYLDSLLGAYYLKNGWEQYGKIGKFDSAVLEFKKGLEVEPSNVDLWYNMGGAYYTMNQYDKAMEAWQKALQLKPDRADIQNAYGSLKAMIGNK